jgi:hypothetical protein
MILFMVVSISSSGKVKHEGYGYITIPSTPGSHTIRMQTWKLKPRSIEEQMQNLFLDVSPSLQDVHSIHVPISDTDVRISLTSRTNYPPNSIYSAILVLF